MNHPLCVCFFLLIAFNINHLPYLIIMDIKEGGLNKGAGYVRDLVHMQTLD